jgi:acyl transferase domain-containing protein/acyl carrier protein/SAM-dependent methyltransferase
MAQRHPDNAIAIVGMACKFPGAEDIEEYWDILHAGRSMCREAPKERFATKENRRNQEKSIYNGNFIEEIDSFDHKFFRKSSREAASMDPQQRLLLEVAYQALESSGYFGPSEVNTDVGCYIGVCASDYNDNVASHPPNAFSTLGTLRAFLSGKISHFFGWSGPSVTCDTACSSSAVAIDAACKAIQLGSCYSAVAGGVSIFTSPYFFQNLSAASFLSATGATKSFDADADGYCRGEGVGLVVLKKLAHAVADRDHILGVISSTAVKQSSNIVPITVPYSPSQTALYRKVLALADVAPEEVTYLEAHGTGTRIGDPQEYEGIRELFGSQKRQEVLYFASVKGNIGHTEGASGVAGLIKTVLMMQKRVIPRQASFTRLNPKIDLEPGKLAVPTCSVTWTPETLIACVNNYGAAGSIAAMVIRQSPHQPGPVQQLKPLTKYPMFLSANSAGSLGQYATKLRTHINKLSPSSRNTLADLAFTLGDKQNRSLPYIVATTVSSMSELDDQLRVVASVPGEAPSQPACKAKPVVLAFGGQTNRFVGLNKAVLESSLLLQSYLNECDQGLLSLGCEGIYPGIFEVEPRDSIVALQTMQFSLQYACAKAWIDSGLRIDCVIGHSFGQLVALAVCGALSLIDGLKLVHGRAVLMEREWGSERGAMIAVDADVETTLKLISSARASNKDYDLEIACYNGPKSQVVVGSGAAIDGLVETLNQSAAVKYKKLNVTHGFHSRFTEPILPELRALAQSLTFHPPKIPIETCSDVQSWPAADPKVIAEHTRIPVYFSQAVERITHRFGPCTWLEAGSNSSIVSMARRALNENMSKHSLFPINLSREDATGSLADTIVNLWKSGHQVQFWPFHRLQRDFYAQLSLPPYQFEKTKHWLDWAEIVPETAPANPAVLPREEERESTLLSLIGFSDGERRGAEFCVEPRSEEWRRLVEGHAVLGNPLCPAPLYVELVSRAVLYLADTTSLSSPPVLCLRSLEIVAPLGLSQDAYAKLQLTRVDDKERTWKFAFYARPRQLSSTTSTDHGFTLHATGEVSMGNETEVRAEFKRTERLLPYRIPENLLAQTDGEAMNGSLVYRVFNRVVRYDDYYKGVHRIVSKDGAVAAQVVLQNPDLGWTKDHVCNPLALDNFLQVAGLHVNSLNVCGENEVSVCTKVERIQLSPSFDTTRGNGDWAVFSNLHPISDKEVENDVYVFDAATEKLVLIVLGAHFSKVLVTSLGKVLARANTSGTPLDSTRSNRGTMPVTTAPDDVPSPATKVQEIRPTAAPAARTLPNGDMARLSEPDRSSLEKELRQLLGRITEIPEKEFRGEAALMDLGIDSLMVTEIMAEVSTAFDVDIPQDDLQDLSTFQSLRDYLVRRTARSHNVSYEAKGSDTQAAFQADNQFQRVDKGSLDVIGKTTPNEEANRRLAQLVASHLDSDADFLRSTNLANRGLDSLLCMELATDIQRSFGIDIDVTQLTTESTFADLSDMVVGPSSSGSSSPHDFMITTPVAEMTTDTEYENVSVPEEDEPDLTEAQRAFQKIQYDYDMYAKEVGFIGFWKNVFPTQSRLVLAYVVEAFADLGCPLDLLQPGQKVPQLPVLPKHERLRGVFYEILRDSQLILYNGVDYIRSETRVDPIPSAEIYAQIIREHPQHAKEHQLLHLCGSILAQLVSGQRDPIHLLFGTKKNKELLEQVYSNGPMYLAMTRLLGDFLEKALTMNAHGHKKIHILELGAGTGATTRWVADVLARAGIAFTYTFSDISPSLVAAAKRKFSKYDFMEFMVLDIEKNPPEKLAEHYHTILSTNCIHATSNLPRSLTHIYQMLQPGGFVSLVEFTKNMFWFDIVFGLLEGWWLFNDGREHVLADEAFWEQCMRSAGFQHVAMTEGPSLESNTVRIITAFTEKAIVPTQSWIERKDEDSNVETVAYSTTEDGLMLCADIHYPAADSLTSSSRHWPIGKFFLP